VDKKVEALRDHARSLIKQAREIAGKAERAGRPMNDMERHEVDALLSSIENVKREIDSREQSGRKANGVRAKTGRADGWKAVAEAFARGDTRVETKLADLMSKDVDAADVTDRAARREAGIRPLTEDLRNLVGALPTIDPGQGALAIEAFSIASRGLATGSAAVERDPMAETAKAEVDLNIDFASVDLRQFAAMVRGIPRQAFESVPELTSLLQRALDIELTQALDAHALAQIAAANPPNVSGGAGFLARVRRAVTDMEADGGKAQIVIASPADLEAVDLMTEDSLPAGFARDRFGLRYIAHPAIAAGAGFVIDPSGLTLYRAGARFDRDPFTGMDTNTERVRLEYNALVHVAEANKIVDLAAA
jgi:hypothetical protein